MATKRPTSLLRILRMLALVATILAGFKLVNAVIAYNASFPAQGIVLDFAQTDEAFAPDRTPIIAFIDYRNQKLFGTPESALGSSAALLGQKIPIRYIRDNPNSFRLDTVLGMWGSGVITLLYGLVPFLILNFITAPTSKRKPARPRARQRKSTLNVSHLVDHTQSTTDTDRPVVRRMR